MKEMILGTHYDCSLVFAGDTRTKNLNIKYRNKSYIPNVLSFPLDQESGEIFINLRQARREHKKRGESFPYSVSLFVIHGMLHLKGLRHGGTMERQERETLSKLHITNPME